MKKLSFQRVAGSYAVCKCASDPTVAALLKANSIFALIRDEVEMTIVLEQSNIPDSLTDRITEDRDWALYYIKGEFAFGETGIVLSAIKPLSENGIGIFVLSTFSSDLLLIKHSDVERALICLKGAGHNIL